MFYDLMILSQSMLKDVAKAMKAVLGQSLAPAGHQRFSAAAVSASLGFRASEFEAFGKLKHSMTC